MADERTKSSTPLWACSSVPPNPGCPNAPRNGWDLEPEERSVPLFHYLWICKRHRWKILSFVAICVITTLIVSPRPTPLYESTAVIDIDRRMPAGALGEGGGDRVFDYDADEFFATQLELIRSDPVLRPVVQKYKLFDSEKGTIDSQSVKPAELEDAPVDLANLNVTRRPRTYLFRISYRAPDPRRAADVANAIANSYIEQTYNIRYRSMLGLATFMEKQLEELKANMERSSAVLALFERELNVINPEEKTSILSARLLQLNTEYTNAQGERVRKEAAYNSVRSGSLEAAQVSSQGEALKRLGERLSEAQEKFAQVKVVYGADYREYRKGATQVAQLQQELGEMTRSITRRVEIEHREALNREAMLKTAVAETKAEFDRLNARSFEYQSLRREAEAGKKLYEELVRKIKEAGINAGFRNSIIRLAVPARPAAAPVSSNIKRNLLLALLLSTILAVGAAVLSNTLDNTIHHPEQARSLFAVRILGGLPSVKSRLMNSLQALLPAPPGAGRTDLATGPGRSGRELAWFGEAIGSLRHSILLGTHGQRLKSLIITSAEPAAGKTTVAVCLALTHARQGHKTLLIDADLRRPDVHRRIGVPNEGGLVAVLSNGSDWKNNLVKAHGFPDLDILPAGRTSRDLTDFVGNAVAVILEQATSEYDLVIVDSPPLPLFPEPLLMATSVDGVVLLIRARQTDRNAVEAALHTLADLQANVTGLALNDVARDGGGYYPYYNYDKYYSSNGRRGWLPKKYRIRLKLKTKNGNHKPSGEKDSKIREAD
ncbi:MAG: polysaccharide biosynthesis tyrosine autokinase [Bryobacterales bacterium]|nr:polysaccharide biosynthesis tyrosine autokinase [Bryobacterales bacterium]